MKYISFMLCAYILSISHKNGSVIILLEWIISFKENEMILMIVKEFFFRLFSIILSLL